MTRSGRDLPDRRDRGDGTGPEVVQEGLKVLEAVRQVEGFDADLVELDLGGERYLRTGETLPDDGSTNRRSTRSSSAPSATPT